MSDPSPSPPADQPKRRSGPIFMPTAEQRKRIELLTIDCLTFDLNEAESLRYFAMRAPDLAKLTVETFRRYKKKVRSDPYYSEWIKQFIKAGYVKMYKDRIDEMLALNGQIKRLLLEEQNLPRTKEERDAWKKAHPTAIPPRIQNPFLIVSYSSQMVQINKRLTQLQNSGPVAAKVHAILRILSPDTPPQERKTFIEQLASSHG